MFNMSEKPQIQEIQIIYHATTRWPLSAKMCAKYDPSQIFSTFFRFANGLFIIMTIFQISWKMEALQETLGTKHDLSTKVRKIRR